MTLKICFSHYLQSELVLKILPVLFCGLAHFLVKKHYIDWFHKNYIQTKFFIKPKQGLLCSVESSYSCEEIYFCLLFNVNEGICLVLVYFREMRCLVHHSSKIFFACEWLFCCFVYRKTNADYKVSQFAQQATLSHLLALSPKRH